MNKKKLNRRIRQCEAEIENIRTLPYYTLFNRERERAADLQEAIKKLAVVREKYSGALKIVYGCRLMATSLKPDNQQLSTDNQFNFSTIKF